ncbi:MAG: hypothetical protein U5K43_07155 [Halofilum sp. (in: g-proteobacteria)]|nr:hypothetical protein [Halofilum sp. (in: g-proteobacteria)]
MAGAIGIGEWFEAATVSFPVRAVAAARELERRPRPPRDRGRCST